MQPVATPLSNFKSICELLSVFIDVLDTHMTLVMQYFILHRDISNNNLMIYPCNISKGKTKQRRKVEASSNEECLRDDKGFQDDNRDSHIESHHNDAADSGKEETHEQKLHRWDQERHQLIEAGILHNGLLIDFDYVTKLDQSKPWALTAGDCTGTIPFMLANILISYKKDEMMHSTSDDLELLVYVLVWICVLYTGPGTVHQDKHITQTILKPWVSVTSPTDAVNLGLHKRGLTTELSMVTDEFTTFFKPLCSMVDKLLRAVGSSWSTTNDAHNYKTIRDILLEGFGTVKKVPNWSGHKDTHGYGQLKGKVNWSGKQHGQDDVTTAPMSHTGSITPMSHGGSVAPTSSRGSVVPTSQRGSVPASGGGSAVPASGGGSVIPASHGSSVVPMSHGDSAAPSSCGGTSPPSSHTTGALPRSQSHLAGLPSVMTHVCHSYCGYRSEEEDSQLPDHHYSYPCPLVNNDGFCFQSAQHLQTSGGIDLDIDEVSSSEDDRAAESLIQNNWQ
ncbi:hypothetical protein EDC04DRAFT_2895264 [Pisolithus marmoratus]|nr:hypothetical protein EDC04DRAFT_2895264 [Pisolithus marmoratus]